jgi:DNA polymerase III sliding clamp (beta) subunit (PCNA family)
MELELKEALSSILKVVKDKPILIEVRSNKLYVGTYNDFHKVIYETPLLNDNFRITISPEISKELTNFISDDFYIDEKYVLFKKRDGSSTKISLVEDDISLTLLAKGYEKNTKAEFNGKELKEAFSYVKHASNDKSIGDVVMKGAHFTIKPGSSEIMASNGAMLSVSNTHQINPDFNFSEILLLNSDIFNVIKIIGDENVKIGFNENNLTLSYTEGLFTIRIISSLLSGKSPLPYKDVITNTKNSNKLNYVVEKLSFLDAVRQVKIFTENRLKISLYNTGEFEVSAFGSKGEAKRSVNVISSENKKDENLTVDVNVDYLFSYLVSNKSDVIKVSFSGQESPVLFEDSVGIEILASLRKA